MSGKIEAKINITGRVQGVGFRPFIYRMAVKNGLLGYVINLGDAGVEIIVEGAEEAIFSFLDAVRENAPEVSDIEDIHHTFSPFRGRFNRFIIDKSKISGKVATGIYPPDIGICFQNLTDMPFHHSVKNHPLLHLNDNCNITTCSQEWVTAGHRDLTDNKIAKKPGKSRGINA